MTKEHIQTITEYLESNEVVVEFEKGAICAFWKSKQNPLITINTNIRGDKRLFVLLHETGHFRVHQSKQKLNRIEEEHKAWEYGFDLANKLNIPIDKSKYWSYANYHLNAYKKELLNVTS